MFENKFSVFFILPFTESSQLICKAHKRKFLHIMNSVVSFAIEGLSNFCQGDLYKFDAQIGDNLCQLRAYQLTWLAKKWLLMPEFQQVFLTKIDFLKNYKKQLEKVIENLENSISQAVKYDKLLDSKESAAQFLNRNLLDIDLDEDLIFLIACYFLFSFSVRENNILLSICIDQIAQVLDTSKSQAKKIYQKYQSVVCKLGCDFVKNIVSRLPKFDLYKSDLPSLLQYSDNNRLVLPCYIVSEIIFQDCIQAKIPILLSVRRIINNVYYETVYFVVISDETETIKIVSYKDYLLSFCVVIEAEVHYDQPEVETILDYISRLCDLNLINALLANTAMHPQYAGEKLTLLNSDPFLIVTGDKKDYYDQSLKEMQEFALKYGCCKENSSLLFIKHVYSNRIIKQIEALSLESKQRVYDAYQERKSGNFTLAREVLL